MGPLWKQGPAHAAPATLERAPMNIRPKPLVAAALAGAALLAAGGAQAHTDVRWNLSIGLPLPFPVVVAPAPVYVQPAPVYVQPAPVLVEPAPVYRYYYRPAPVYDVDRSGRWDSDGDGVPNRHDRRPHDPWRR